MDALHRCIYLKSTLPEQNTTLRYYAHVQSTSTTGSPSASLIPIVRKSLMIYGSKAVKREEKEREKGLTGINK